MGRICWSSSTLFETFMVQQLIICNSIITFGCRLLRWCRINVAFDSGGSWFVSQLAVYLCSRWTRWQWFPKAKGLNSWWVLAQFQNSLAYQTNCKWTLQESWDFGGWRLSKPLVFVLHGAIGDPALPWNLQSRKQDCHPLSSLTLWVFVL